MLFTWNSKLFEDRSDAGRQLAASLKQIKDENLIVLSIPRGGVPIGYELSETFNAILEVVVVRKIGLPNRPEYGIGAIAENNIQIFDQNSLIDFDLLISDLENVIQEEIKELKRRVKLYRNNMNFPDVKNKTILLVDDGLATGATAQAAIEAVRKKQPKRIIFASPVCALDSIGELKSKADEVYCLYTPNKFSSVGEWYQHFEQVADEEVIRILKKSRAAAT
jgi:putative phosphoribosyl transferase